jgi:chromosomal replication initiator protein
MENTWDKAKSFLKTEINEQVFTVWFAPIQLSGMDDGSITLTVPNQFFQNWIQEKYISLIKSAVFQASGKELEVRFEIKKQDPPADAPEAEKEEKQDSPDKPSTMGWLKTVFSGTKQMPESRYQEIGLNPKYNFENFVVGPGNRFAHAAALAVCENPARSYNPLFIHGGVGLGKTHILQSIGYQVLLKYPRAKIFYISSEEFTNQLINAIRTKTTAKFREMYRNADILLIDDIQFLAGKESTQEEFFHTFNTLYDAHKQIVLSSDRSPKNIPNLEERLVSRFAWGLTADIQPPDFETRTAILAKKSENESVPVPDEVLSFLAEKINTNIRELEGALIRVVAYAKLTACDLSVDLAREVLKGMIEEEVRTTTIPGIQAVVSDYFGLTIDVLKSKKRSQAVAHPRQIAMYLSRELTRYSFPDIGGYFGGKDHTTVMHAYNKISNEIKQDALLKTTIERLVNRIQNK